MHDEKFLNRLLAKIDFTETCWLWTGAKDNHGYGRIHAKGGSRLPHRILYEMCNGPIVGEIDHLCRNRACVNPQHLQAVPHRINMQRGVFGPHHRNGTKTHCLLGHPLSGTNLYVYKNVRQCRLCRAMRSSAYYYKAS